VQVVQWFPGHIARAERQLREQLKMVDVILEVRDARCVLSTEHPQLDEWARNKPRLLLLNRADMISDRDRARWQRHFDRQRQAVFWTTGNSGAGVVGVKRAVRKVAAAINARRERRGLQPRACRLVAIGFPNVGKSALLNRLAGRRAYASAAKPGVTRQLRWVRVDDDVDLLDAPGVLPMRFDDQVAAARLCMVNNIGEASYTPSLIAAALVARLRALESYADDGEGEHAGEHARGGTRRMMVRRWGIPEGEVDRMSCEDVVKCAAENLFFGDEEKAAARILKDFRGNLLGRVALELPPAAEALE